jgi:hypothetical protein
MKPNQFLNKLRTLTTMQNKKPSQMSLPKKIPRQLRQNSLTQRLTSPKSKQPAQKKSIYLIKRSKSKRPNAHKSPNKNKKLHNNLCKALPNKL